MPKKRKCRVCGNPLGFGKHVDICSALCDEAAGRTRKDGRHRKH